MQLALSKTIQNTKILLLSRRTNYAIIKSDQTSQMAAVNGLRINPSGHGFPSASTMLQHMLLATVCKNFTMQAQYLLQYLSKERRRINMHI